MKPVWMRKRQEMYSERSIVLLNSTKVLWKGENRSRQRHFLLVEKKLYNRRLCGLRLPLMPSLLSLEQKYRIENGTLTVVRVVTVMEGFRTVMAGWGILKKNANCRRSGWAK